jgi:hypothetical protein
MYGVLPSNDTLLTKPPKVRLFLCGSLASALLDLQSYSKGLCSRGTAA